MIGIDKLREQYEKMIFFGAIENTMHKYRNYLRKNDYIVDSNIDKQGKKLCGLVVGLPSKIVQENSKKVAIVILALNHEKEIYNRIRKLGYDGDVYSDDMICFDKDADFSDDRYYVTNGQYTIEKHTQILIALLKAYGVKNIVVSPGTCNKNLVYSLQNDSYFKLWSCIDERSAGYMACGIAQTLGTPVGLSCTGATSSRNYMPALTEAYYSKLPIVAITSSRDSFMIGNGIEQVTDRLHLPTDIVKASVEISEIHNINERKYCELRINRTLSMLRIHGGGPVHINLITRFERDYTTKTLPKCRVIKTVQVGQNQFPTIVGKTALFIKPNSGLKHEYLHVLVDRFCELYGAVVIGDNLSEYKGRYFINISLITYQHNNSDVEFDTIIMLGAMNRELCIKSKNSWRVSEDGNMEDPFLNLDYFFDMSVESFLLHYISDSVKQFSKIQNLYDVLSKSCKNMIESMEELPFSNLWIAKNTVNKIPQNSICYFGINSTLKNWNCFNLDETIECYATVGGFGIDGTISAMVGASIANPQKMVFCFLGDLAFFYDLNVLGNKHIQKNVRIMFFNNKGGNSLLNQNGLPPNDFSGEYVGAVGHYKMPVGGLKEYVEVLGYKYLLARDKTEYLSNLNTFLDRQSESPIIFEIDYDKNNDFDAVQKMSNILVE